MSPHTIRALHRRSKKLLLAVPVLLVSACAHQPKPTALQAAQVVPPMAVASAPSVPAFEPLSLPAAEFSQLANGIRTAAFPSARSPYVQMQMQIDAGRLLHGDAADVLAERLRLIGNADSEAAWQQHWRALGASLSVRSGNHRLIFSAEVLPHQADALLDTLLALWQQPNLQTASTHEQAIRNLRTAQREADLQGDDATRLWQRLAYGAEHPYGKSAVPASALRQLTPALVQQQWQLARDEAQQWFFAGAFTPIDLARWQQKLATLAPVAPTPRWRTQQHALAQPATEWQLHVLDSPGATQVDLQLGFALPLQAAAERWHCEALAAVLGNNSGRLFRDLRERRGLSYNPTAFCSAAPLASALQLTASTQPEHTAAMLHGLREHVRMLGQQSISDEEIALLQSSLRGDLRMQLATARQRSSRFHLEEWLGGDWQQLRERDAFWQQLTGPALQQFAIAWLQTEPVTVLRGDADQLLPQLRQLLPHARIIRHDHVD